MNSNFGGSASQTDLTQQPWFHIFQESFDRWEELSGVNYVYEPHDDGVLHPSSAGQLGTRGDIRLGGIAMDGAGGTLAFTYLPIDGSDMAVDTGEASFFKTSANNYRNFRDTLMHELGHSFGLDHVNSSTSNLLMEPVINTVFDGPQLDEVRGAQFYFGDANEKSSGGLGNGAAARATSLGSLTAGVTRSVGASANVPTQAISASAKDFVSIANNDDLDYYSFTIATPAFLSATLTPRGGVFTQGGENDIPTSFNANARNDLDLTLFATDGTSQLALADVNPAGLAETASGVLLSAPGTYFARIAGVDDTIQLYQLDLSITALANGDFNHDGAVDAADYTVWRNSRDQTGPGLAADANGDLQITLADYNIWKTHYGGSLSTGSLNSQPSILNPQLASVPEPTTICTAATAILLLFSPSLLRRRGRAQRFLEREIRGAGVE